MSRLVPVAVQEAAIKTCGVAVYYRSDLERLMRSAGVTADVYDRCSQPDSSKYLIARRIFSELERGGQAGAMVQRQIVRELCALAGPLAETPDPHAGQAALDELHRLTVALGVLDDSADWADDRADWPADRAGTAAGRRARARERNRTAELTALHARFASLHAMPLSLQQRGYELERLLGDLFRLYELPYRPPYRIATEQIDGAVEIRAFTYLIECRWRRQLPNLADLAAFKAKVDSKIDSVRGLFVSIAGFRPEVVERIRHTGRANLILMSGHELALILEGRWPLLDALTEKIRRAEHEGAIWHDLAALPPPVRPPA